MSERLKTFLLASVVIFLGAGAVSATGFWAFSRLDHGSVDTVEPTATADGPMATVVVSSNLSSGGDCHDHYTDGCDLFSAQVDLSSGAVSEVKQLTTGPEGDIAPVLSADLKNVFYTESSDTDTAMELSLKEGGESRSFSTATNHPSPLADGSKAYLVLTNGFFLATVDLQSAKVSVQKIEGMSSVHEPHVSPTGLVSFYRLTQGETRGSGSAQAMIYVPSTGKTIEVSEADGTAHCFWNFDGSQLYCNNRNKGGILAYSVATDGTVGDSRVAIAFPSASVLGQVDNEFTSECLSTSLEYGSFCDDNHVLLTAGCMIKGEEGLDQKFAETVILNIETDKFLPVGRNIAESFGKTGNTWTGTCRVNDE